ncbi:plastocyanin/azurin family copper-binding protein [Haladaptatus sp. CMAA 1911]|uniref:plastocyanin/azurin family copper-binding protein n=1 Tax=unclassified Haladaptatus TaxID=2622732 RepID=UPI00375455D0
MRRRAYLAGATVSLATSLTGCANLILGSSRLNGDISMGSQSFNPQKFETKIGETVVWANTDMRRHSVTAYENAIPKNAEYFASGGFESEQAARDAWRKGHGTVDPKTTFKRTFEIPGTYSYFCVPHEMEGMTGRIIVKE